MKKIIMIILLLFIYVVGSSTTYYVKSNGNDLALGTSDATAWNTLVKVDATEF